jgi:hypothetical protein
MGEVIAGLSISADGLLSGADDGPADPLGDGRPRGRGLGPRPPDRRT